MAPPAPPRWVHALASLATDSELWIEGVATDPNDNFYLTGRFWGDSLSNLALGARVGAYITAKCDGAGRFQWCRPVTTRPFDPNSLRVPVFQMQGIAADAQGNVVVSGIASGRTYFGIPATDSVATLDTVSTAILYRYSATGTLQWVRASHGSGVSSDLTVDAAGTTYVCVGLAAGAEFAGLLATRGGSHLVKVSAQGRARWMRPFPGFTSAVCRAGSLYAGGVFVDSVTVGSFHLQSPRNSRSFWPYVAQCDTAGTVLWARTAAVELSTGANMVGIGTDAAGHVYGCGSLYGRDATGLPSQLNFDGHIVKGRGTYVVRFAQAAQVTGTAYLDVNANGRRDAGEDAFPHSVVVSEDHGRSDASTSPATGRYTLFADTGAYHVGLPHVPAHYALTQGAAGYSGHLRTYGQTDTARHFGLAPIANQADVRVTITPYTAARRGFVNRYRVRVENVGTVTATGQVSVTFDPNLSYISASPTPAQQTGTTVRWNVSGLAPFGKQDFDLSLTVPLNVALGTVVRSRATVTVPNDLDPTNDADSTRQTVSGSWDPNELTVNYSTLTPAQIAAGTELDYVIHFQNLGTDTAFTVVITDTLAAHLLQLGTLYVVAQSHNCRVDLLGNTQLVIRFDDINLPPTSVNIMESGGFIRFRVRPRATLTPGALIPNTAHIVFDYNAPLATNEVTTLVQTPNGLVAESGASSWDLYPNPAHDRVTVTGLPGTRATVFDALGRPVRRAVLTDSPLQLTGLAQGVYVVRLEQPGGAATSRKLIIR